MFDLENHELITKLVNMRDDGEYVIPLYVQVYGKRYGILELDQITDRFTRNIFKVGFGVSNGLFVKDSFPPYELEYFNVVKSFICHDEETGADVCTSVIETGDVAMYMDRASDPLRGQISDYYNLLYDHVYKQVDQHIKSLITTDFD